MIHSIIIDDERHSVETLRWKLNRFCPEVRLVECFTDPVKALEFLRDNPLELVFLDIAMPRLTGFDLLKQLGEIPFEVIFTTAYDDYGIQAIKYSALDYLLKPVAAEELKQAVEKFKEKRGREGKSQQWELLFQHLRDTSGATRKIALPSREKIEFVDPAEIILCSSDSNYTQVFLADGGKRLLSRTLKEFEELLTPFHFFRAHHSHLINLQQIREFVKADGGYLVMSNGMKVPVSRSRKEELLGLF
jgi:two-component system LytT family response regulator